MLFIKVMMASQGQFNIINKYNRVFMFSLIVYLVLILRNLRQASRVSTMNESKMPSNSMKRDCTNIALSRQQENDHPILGVHEWE